MQTTTDSTQPLKAFINAFGKGDFEGIIETFHPVSCPEIGLHLFVNLSQDDTTFKVYNKPTDS